MTDVYRSFCGFLDVVHVSFGREQNDKRLFCRWDCVGILNGLAHKFQGSWKTEAVAQMTVAIRQLL
jgi:hypothetical protein